MRHGPLQAAVDRPLPLKVWTTRDAPFRGDGRPINVRWFKHRGPGSVTFSRVDDRLEVDTWRARGAGGTSETEATFGAPGEYVLRALAYNTIREFEFQCCWTNGYVHVNVTD